MVIQIETRSVYGIVKFYPANEAAKTLTQLTGTKTLSAKDLIAAKRLGYVVEEVHTKRLEQA